MHEIREYIGNLFKLPLIALNKAPLLEQEHKEFVLEKANIGIHFVESQILVDLTPF